MKKLYIGVLTLVLALCLTGCGSDDTSKDESPEPSTSAGSTDQQSNEPEQTEPEQTEPEEEFYFKDNVAVTDSVKIEISDYKVLQPGDEGNQYGNSPVIAFWYEVTNLKEDPTDPTTNWLFIFSATQGDADLSVAPLPDSSFLDTQLEDIAQGESLKNAVAYTLEDESTPVVLEATKGLLGAELGTQEYSLS